MNEIRKSVNPIKPALFTVLVFVLLTTGACSSKHDYPFDTKQWQKDKKGCLGVRLNFYTALIDEKKSFLKLSENQLVDVLGLPDANELSKRNQKFFIYNVSPSNDCKDSLSVEPLFLIVRFSATGLSSEVFLHETPGPFY